MKHINIEQITCIESYTNRISFKFTYKHEIKVFGIILRREGFYDAFKNYITYKNLDSNIYYIDDVLHVIKFKPYLELNLSDKSSERIYFKKEEDLNSYVNDHLLNIKLIEIK